MGGGARRGRSGFRRQRPAGRRVAFAVAGYPPSGGALSQLRRYRTIGCQPACRTPDRTLVSARTARSRQAVCRCPLIRLPDAAIGVRRLRAAAPAARGALRGPWVRLALLFRSRWSGGEVADTRQCAAGALTLASPRRD